MLPFARMFNYGNTILLPKVQYDFSTGYSTGMLTPTKITGNYFGLPSNSEGYTAGISSGVMTLPAYTIGTKDYYIEAVFYLNTIANQYNTIAAPGDTIGFRYGDNGFGNRLQFSDNYGVLNAVYSYNLTKSTTYGKIITVRMERKNNVLRCYLNGVQQNFAAGTSQTYDISSAPDTMNIPQYTTITLGSDQLYLIKITVDF